MTQEEHRAYQREYHRRYRAEHRAELIANDRARRQRKAAERGPITATCAVCGKTFVKTGHNQRFCSRSCWRTLVNEKARASRVKKPRQPTRRKERLLLSKTCPVCGKTFETRFQHQVYCSPSCQSRARRKPAQTHVCGFCGRRFTAKTSRARFCSPRCAGRVRLGYATLAEFEQAHAQRKVAFNKQRERDRNGLTLAQIQAVIDAQSGDPSRLWKLSQSWTRAQRKYAKKRYEEMHGLFPLRISL